MLRYFLKLLFRFVLPALILCGLLTAGYIYYDPFRVLRSYEDYSYSAVALDRDYVSTEMFLKHNPQRHYNSFILGSSRTLAFRPAAWVKHLPGQARPFKFDASAESVFGIYTKLKYLDATGAPIDNLLLVLCHDFTFKHTANTDEHLFMKHPAVTGESRLHFQWAFFQCYLQPKFFFNYYMYRFTRHTVPFLENNILAARIGYDPATNEFRVANQAEERARDPDAYYRQRRQVFYKRQGETVDRVPQIGPKALHMLQEISAILEKHHTNYKVVISPLYEQVKYNPADMERLRQVFGDRLYDFSGKNAITDDRTNYYEASHFVYSVGDSIMNIIYR